MPGPPILIESDQFLPTVIFITGQPNQGKSTLANALNSYNQYITTIYLDAWCYEYLNPKNINRFDLGKFLNRTTKDIINKILEYILIQINLLPNTHKIYIYEGTILEYQIIYNAILDYYKQKQYRIWTITKK